MHLIEAAREGRTPHRDFKLFEERIDRDRDRDGNNSYSHSNSNFHSNSHDYRGNGNHNSSNNGNGNGNGIGNGNMNGNQYNQYTRNNYDDKVRVMRLLPSTPFISFSHYYSTLIPTCGLIIKISNNKIFNTLLFLKAITYEFLFLLLYIF